MKKWTGLTLALSLITGCASFQGRFARETGDLGLPGQPDSSEVVREADIQSLPKPVQRYLRFMGVVGRPRDWSFRWAWSGRFRTAPEASWTRCEALQYNSRLRVSRIFHMQLPINGLPVMVRDTYSDGKARMLGKIFDLVPVVDERGEEVIVGELVTYLNDAIMVAPSMLLTPQTTWTGVDDESFDVTLTDCGRTVKARVFLDAQGAPKNFSTTDRFIQDPYDPKHPFVRREWTTPIENWVSYEGRKFATHGFAVWKLPQGDFPYGEINLDPKGLSFNLPPGK
ncbi:MAG: DUF6544 family protein [Bacteroidota bacterium]